jgi:Spy/CpxP family protein refolding chaperone
MNRLRTLAIGTLAFGITLMFVLTAAAQQAATGPAAADNGDHSQRAARGDVPSVELQLKTLTEKLDLSSNQQAKLTPILKKLHDATLKLVEDDSLSNQERLDKVRPYRFKARDQMLAILSDDQKKKLDEYFQGPHPEMHGSLTGAPSSQAHPQM